MFYLAAILSLNVYAFSGTFLNHDDIVKRFETKVFQTTTHPADRPMMGMERRPYSGRVQTFEIPKEVSSKIDLRHRDTPAKRQFGSTCSAFGLTASIENALFEQAPMDLSERHLWSKYHKYSSDSAIQAALNKGAITGEKYWPMNNWFPSSGFRKNAKAFLIEAPYLDGKVDLALKALDEHRPVYLGIAVTDSLYACHEVVDPKSPTNGGGHAVSIVGYGLDRAIAGGGYFIIKNSWSKECGDHGYQYVPFNYCTREDMYCIMWDIKEVALK